MPELTSRIVILHSSARRAVDLYRLFTGLGYDVASNWPVEQMSLQPDWSHTQSPQAAVYSNEVLIAQARKLGSDVCAANAIAIDAAHDPFWAGFVCGLRMGEAVPVLPSVFVGPPGGSLGLQLMVNNPGRRTQVGHVSEWSDVPAALNALGVAPKVTIPEPSNGEADVREPDSAVAPEQPVVADQPEDPDRDHVAGGES